MSSGGLDTRPGAITLGLDDLVEMAWDGHIRVPYFQRDFQWTGRDVMRLFDSILRRYPIGSLLLWKRKAPEQHIVLGELAIDAPALDDARWVVDGQQRIVSLVNVLRSGERHDSRFTLGYDTRNDSIVALAREEDGFVVPLNVVFDLDRVLTWFAEHPEAMEMRQTTFALTKQLREFTVPAYQVVQDDVDVLQDIFDRMNNSGKKLTRAQVFSALNAGTESASDERLTLTGISSYLADRYNFGTIDDGTVLLSILARRGADVQREFRVEFDHTNRRGTSEFGEETQEEASRAGMDAMAKAVEFLIENGIPHVAVLPYKYLLVVLTRFFAHHPEPDPTNRQLLGRWLWRASSLGPGVFKGSTTGTARILCGRVRPGDLSGSVRDLLSVLPMGEARLPDLLRFRPNEASTKITICSWWDLHPRNPSGVVGPELAGEAQTFPPYTNADLAEALIDRKTASVAVRLIFPQNVVAAKAPDHRLAAGNRVLLPTLDQPALVVGDLLQTNPIEGADEWDDVLRSLAFPPEAGASLAADDVRTTLDNRQRALESILRSFLQRKCEWNLEDTPPLRDLEVEDLEGESDDAD